MSNDFTDTGKNVNSGEKVFLTKNGYGSMVVMSLETYSNMTKNVEHALDEADEYAATKADRMTHEEVFGSLRKKIKD